MGSRSNRGPYFCDRTALQQPLVSAVYSADHVVELARHSSRRVRVVVDLCWKTAPARAHSRGMAKKRSGIADGIKTAYHVHQALEAVQSVTASKVREFIDGLKEIALMAATLVAVVGVL